MTLAGFGPWCPFTSLLVLFERPLRPLWSWVRLTWFVFEDCAWGWESWFVSKICLWVHWNVRRTFLLESQTSERLRWIVSDWWLSEKLKASSSAVVLFVTVKEGASPPEDGASLLSTEVPLLLHRTALPGEACQRGPTQVPRTRPGQGEERTVVLRFLLQRSVCLCFLWDRFRMYVRVYVCRCVSEV